MAVTNSDILMEFQKMGESLVNCSHGMCSMAESVHEEKYGKMILNKVAELREKLIYEGVSNG